MILRLSRWPALALTSALALSACAGAGGPAVPSQPGFSQAASVARHSVWAPSIANPVLELAQKCPERFTHCITVPRTKSVELIWCYGPESDPCGDSDAGKAKWSGVVCLAKGATCKGPIKLLTAKWSGPFKCKSSECTGTYELDTITPGAGLKETKTYLYKQDIHLCPKSGGSCEDEYIGINVGP
jgi:hypothetical protein